jgi:predicted glutamine amidotransferase
MSDGNHVVALFNRSDTQATITADFAALGISDQWKVRDLWSHADEGMASVITASLPAHGCKIVKLSK